MNKYLISLISFLMLTLPLRTIAQTELRHGDLLFNVTDTTTASEFAKSIVGSTRGIDKMKVSHVAIVCQEDSGTFVLEATARHGVWMTPLKNYFEAADKDEKGNPMVLVGHIKNQDADLITSVQNAKAFLGLKYDFTFDPSDDEMYCSELVQKSYVTTDGKLLFPTIPMSFHDEDGKILPYWINYYLKRNLDVPEGEPGSNPGQLSRDKNVEILSIKF